MPVLYRGSAVAKGQIVIHNVPGQPHYLSLRSTSSFLHAAKNITKSGCIYLLHITWRFSLKKHVIIFQN